MADILWDPAYLWGIVTGSLTVVAAIWAREGLHRRRLRRAWREASERRQSYRTGQVR